mmetsp:Transcript_12422/g.37449  ORF Transcript_12422/g.37449 Transcript_12422/m.37449 type:complete len:506 (-) Transcript_12422:178-1695(-)
MFKYNMKTEQRSGRRHGSTVKYVSSSRTVPRPSPRPLLGLLALFHLSASTVGPAPKERLHHVLIEPSPRPVHGRGCARLPLHLCGRRATELQRLRQCWAAAALATRRADAAAGSAGANLDVGKRRRKQGLGAQRAWRISLRGVPRGGSGGGRCGDRRRRLRRWYGQRGQGGGSGGQLRAEACASRVVGLQVKEADEGAGEGGPAEVEEEDQAEGGGDDGDSPCSLRVVARCGGQSDGERKGDGATHAREPHHHLHPQRDAEMRRPAEVGERRDGEDVERAREQQDGHAQREQGQVPDAEGLDDAAVGVGGRRVVSLEALDDVVDRRDAEEDGERRLGHLGEGGEEDRRGVLRNLAQVVVRVVPHRHGAEEERHDARHAAPLREGEGEQRKAEQQRELERVRSGARRAVQRLEPAREVRASEGEGEAERDGAGQRAQHVGEHPPDRARDARVGLVGERRLCVREEHVEEDDREGIVERRLAKDEVVQERRGAHVLEDAEGGDGVCG